MALIWTSERRAIVAVILNVGERNTEKLLLGSVPHQTQADGDKETLTLLESYYDHRAVQVILAQIFLRFQRT